MDQGHILEGLRTGDKSQKASFAKQIGNIDFQLFRHAMSSVSKQIDRVASSSLSRKNTVRVPYKTLGNHEDREKYAFTGEINKGLEILLKPKAAIVLVGNDSADSDITVDVELQKVLNSFSELMEVEEKCIAVPFIIISPAGQVESVRNCLVENDYFGLDRQKVWVLGEMELPIVSISSGSNNKKILLESPWEILQRPAGSGGIFSLLASSKILDTLNGMGAEYVQICSLNNSFAVGHPLFFGAVSSRGADVGVKLCKTSKMEDHFDVIVSMSHLNRISKDVTKLRFSAHQEQHVHAAHVNGEWITVQPEAPNSYRLHSDVTCVLDSCSPDKVCVMEVFE